MSGHRRKGTSTIKDVARACGVSEATVSYVINGKRVLKPETREKVYRTMREMNYYPSAVARGLSSKRVHTLGVLFGVVSSVDYVTNPYSCGILQGVLAQAQLEGFYVTLFTEPWQSGEVSAPPLRDGRTDGILVIAPPMTTDILPSMSSLNVPIIAISAQPNDDVPVVDVDNRTGAQLAARHLVQLGHQRIAYLMGEDDMASHLPRRAAFCEVLEEAGLELIPEFMQVSHFDGSTAFEQTSALLRHPKPPTAIMAGNDTIALAVIEAARCAGWSVPHQLSVVGFDDIPAATLVTPNLTTVHQPLMEIGETATRLLIERMRGQSQEKEEQSRNTTLLAPELVVRGSTAQASRIPRRR